MAVDAGVVVVERMGGDGVDERGIRRACLFGSKQHTRFIASPRADFLLQDPDDRLAAPGEQHADAVDRAALDGLDRLRRQSGELERSDELRELLGEAGHGRSQYERGMPSTCSPM